VATPNIGVTCNLEVVKYGIWTEPAAMVPLTYVRAIARAGGRPLLIAPTPADLEDPAELLDMLDGVLVTGGADLDPATYDEEPHEQTDAAPRDRDDFELLLVRAAAERDLPCLGICRGMQVVNVAYGGALEQHLPDRLADDIHRGDGAAFADHHVDVDPESLAAIAAGATHVAVKSYHHQGVARIGDGLTPTARAATDGTVEAVEDATRRFMLGVLWHPEEDEADRLIGAFVRECREAAGLSR
jgi:putative glutamine amidotransferase